MPFLNIEKIVLIFGRMALIVAIFGLNFSFKMFPCRASFSAFLTKSLSKCLSATNLSPFPRIISGCGTALRHYSFCKTLHLNCLIVFWICLCLDNYSVICKWSHAMYFIRRIQNYGIFSTLFFQAMMSQVQLFTRERGSFLKLCRHIKSYSALLRHIHAYSGIFSTLCNSRTSKTLPYSYLKPYQTLTGHIQNPAIGHYSAIFRTVCNACICRNLENLESWNI